MRPIQDDPLFLAFKREWEGLSEEPDSDTYNRMKIVPYVMAALAVFTLVCLGAGVWLRGAW